MRRLLSYATIAIFISLNACKKPMGFEYRDLKNFHLQNIGSENSEVSLDLVYYNPNKFGVDLKNVNCNIYVNSMYIGNFKLDTTMHVPRTSEFTLPGRFEVNTKNILKNSINLLFNEITLTAKGTTRVGKAGIFVNVPIDYSGKHKLNLF